MKKMTYLGVLGASTVLCLGFFQNCSKIATADLESPALVGKVTADGAAVSTQNPVLDSTDSSGSIAGSAPTPKVDHNETQVVTEIKDSTSTPVKAPLHLGNVDTGETEIAVPTPKKDDTCKPDDKDCIKKNKDEVALITAACLGSSSKSIGSNGSIHHISGPVDLSVTDTPSAIHHLESLIARPAAGLAKASVGEIHHIEKDVVLCNLEIDSIHNIVGNVTLINCKLRHKWHDISGVVKEISN